MIPPGDLGVTDRLEQESGEIEISDEFDLPAVQDNQERTPEPNE